MMQTKHKTSKFRKKGIVPLGIIAFQIISFLLPMGLGVLAPQLTFMTVTQTRAADGAAGGISVSTTMIITGLPLSIRAYDLTNNADYKINHTNDDTGISFTAAGTTHDWVYPNVAMPSSGSTVTVYLRAQSAGTTLASASVSVFSLTAFLATGVIISAGVFVLIVVIIKRIAKK
jgi:hypothetical protein